MAEIIIAAILLFTNKAYMKPDEIRIEKVYAEENRDMRKRYAK